VMRLFRAGGIDDLDAITSLNLQQIECEACTLGKGKRLTTLRSAPPDTRASNLLDLVHVDLWGPATASSMGGKRYFLTCYDDFSHHINLYFLANKSDALAALKEYAAMAETQTGRKIKQIRSDGGGEFNSNAAILFYRQNGIEHVLVPPGSHQQNGRVESVHLTILNLVRTYLTDCTLPPTFWAEAASYAAYIRNRTPCKPSNNIPDDLWYGKKKSHLHLQPFGCKVYYRRHEIISKLDNRYNKGILLGYIAGTSSYRIWDNERCKLVKTRDVIFPLSNNTNTGLELVEIEDGPSNLGKPPSTPKLEEIEEELDNVQIKQSLPAPVVIEQSPELSPSLGPAPRRSARLQSIASQLESDSESEVELLLTDKNADPNGNIATALHHALAAFAAHDTYLQAEHPPEWPDWSSAMSNELDNKRCEWWKLDELILAKLTVPLVTLQLTKPPGLLKAIPNWKESITTSFMLQWRTRIQFESSYHLSITLTLNVIKWTLLPLSLMVI